MVVTVHNCDKDIKTNFAIQRQNTQLPSEKQTNIPTFVSWNEIIRLKTMRLNNYPFELYFHAVDHRYISFAILFTHFHFPNAKSELNNVK